MASAGIFYSLMVLSLLAPIVLYIISYMEAVQTQGEQMTVKFEGIELANYADSIALDVPRVLDIASKRAIVAVIDYDDEHNGYPINDSEYELRHLIIYNNYSAAGDAPIMLNSSFSNWINSTVLIGANHGFISEIVVDNLKINHSDPFTINFSIQLHANITDRIGSMRLVRNYTAETLVSVEGFTDPLYPLNTRGLIDRVIRKANMTINDTASMIYMINNSVYVNNSDAPAFLERLQGCTYPTDGPPRPNPNHNCTGRYPNMGIESMVYFPELRAHFEETDPVLKANSSMVDHWYFNSSYVEGCNVTGISDMASMPNYWFRLDGQYSVRHNTTYGFTLNCT